MANNVGHKILLKSSIFTFKTNTSREKNRLLEWAGPRLIISALITYSSCQNCLACRETLVATVRASYEFVGAPILSLFWQLHLLLRSWVCSILKFFRASLQQAAAASALKQSLAALQTANGGQGSLPQPPFSGAPIRTQSRKQAPFKTACEGHPLLKWCLLPLLRNLSILHWSSTSKQVPRFVLAAIFSTSSSSHLPGGTPVPLRSEGAGCLGQACGSLLLCR